MSVEIVVWLLLAAVLLAVGLRKKIWGLLPFAVAALVAVAGTVLTGETVIAVFLFVIASLIGRWVVRPALRSAETPEVRARPGAGTLIGRPAYVVERISNDEALGCVRIDDEIWNARSWDEKVIEPGARVHVVEVRGATAVVSS